MTKQTTTRAEILATCLKLAAIAGYRNITRDVIAEAASVPPSLVSYHMGTMIELRRHVMREAIRTRCLAVIAQGLSVGDHRARKASPELQRAALESLLVKG